MRAASRRLAGTPPLVIFAAISISPSRRSVGRWQQFWRAHSTRATEPNRDNRPVLSRILELRRAKANLLGFRDFADFVLVDDGAPPACGGASNIKVGIAPDTGASDLVVGFASGAAPADYRIYVRSRWIAPETAAVLFAAAHRPLQKLAGRAADRSN